MHRHHTVCTSLHRSQEVLKNTILLKPLATNNLFELAHDLCVPVYRRLIEPQSWELYSSVVQIITAQKERSVCISNRKANRATASPIITFIEATATATTTATTYHDDDGTGTGTTIIITDNSNYQ